MANKIIPASSVNCPSCGAPASIRLPGKTQSLSCRYCGSIFDVSIGEAKVLYEFENIKKKEKQLKLKPKLPIGSRAEFENQIFEVVGFMRKRDNYNSKWDEYLLFNPYLGYRYISYWQGHWSYIRLLHQMPESDGQILVTDKNSNEHIKHEKIKYKRFFNYTARVEYVLGEFNWRVKVDEKVKVTDYINPPYVLSCESSANEVVWSKGEYLEPSVIKKKFALKMKMTKPWGVAPNQVNSFRFKFKVALVFCFLAFFVSVHFATKYDTSVSKQIFSKNFVKDLSQEPVKRGKSYTYKEFQWNIGNIEVNNINSQKYAKDLNLKFEINAEVNNSWVYLNFFLMNEKTRKGYSFGQQISYYHGVSGGESWSEGSRTESFVTEPLAPGKYYVIAVGQTNLARQIRLSLNIIRDIGMWFIFGFMTILGFPVPILYYFLRKRAFETRRDA